MLFVLTEEKQTQFKLSNEDFDATLTVFLRISLC